MAYSAVLSNIHHGDPTLCDSLFSSKLHVVLPKTLENKAARNYTKGNEQPFRNYHNIKSVCSSSRLSAMVCSSSSSSPMLSAHVVVDSDASEEILERPAKATFGRSLWAEDSFYSENDREEYAEEIEYMKEKVRKMLNATGNSTPRDKVVLIDTLERLDIAYHFEREIDENIRQIFEFHSQVSDGDLFTTALYFRLFRQHGFDVVSCRVFDKFKDEDNKFKEALCNDIEGLLSLYEASFVGFEEEYLLRDARKFATHHLQLAANSTRLGGLLSSSSYLIEKVERALRQPLHWSLPKVEARNYISMYEKKEVKDETILRLAKLDFKVMQNMYKKEMHQVREWWYGFDLVSKLPYARDCVVPCYFWAAALGFEPKYSRSRIAAAKALVMASCFNDTYDSYATLDELRVFTDVAQSWDANDIDKLPKYLKIVFNVLLTAFGEFERETSVRGRSYSVAYVKQALSRMASAYYKKANWLNGKEIPTFQDHVEHMGITSGAHQLMSAFFMHVECASKDGFEWLMNEPKAVEEAALYCRYLNDLTSYEREKETGQYPVAVDSYMEEKGVSVQETKDKFAEFAEVSWMTLNKEWILENRVPKELIKPAINFCRIVFASYRYGSDSFSIPEEGLDASINALLVDPMVI